MKEGQGEQRLWYTASKLGHCCSFTQKAGDTVRFPPNPTSFDKEETWQYKGEEKQCEMRAFPVLYSFNKYLLSTCYR